MTKRILLLLLTLLAASAAFAQTDAKIDFESTPDISPSRPVTIGVATFSGGIVARKLINLPENPSAVYFSSANENCNGCGTSRDVVITFSKPVSALSFDLYNGVDSVHWPVLMFYDIFINDGPAFPNFFGAFHGDGWYHNVFLSNDPINKIRIHPNPQIDYWNYTLDNFEFVVNRTSPVRLVTGFGDANNDAAATTKEVGGRSVSVNEPIGSNFFLKLQRKNSSGTWVDVLSKFGPGNASLDDPTLLSPAALWKDYAAFQYGDKNAPDVSRRFQAVHFGYVNIFVEPTDKTIGPLSVSLHVGKDAQLGATKPATGPRSIRNDTQFDARFIDYANRTGIPPQFLKGQADQESELGIGIMDPKNWRYELYSTDSDFVQKFRNNCKLISAARGEYSPYGCEKWNNYLLPNGPLLCPKGPGLPANQANCAFGALVDDLAPRYRTDLDRPLKISRNGAIRVIQPGDDPILGYEIHYAKQGTVIGVPPGTPTPKPPGKQRPSRPPPPYNFVAQTAVASSYGLMQVLWTTANDFDLKWGGVQGRHNPALLFDTDFDETHGGGSLNLGTRYLVKFFDNQNPAALAQTPSFASSAEFETALQNMFQAYNKGMAGYGAAVMAKSARYPPQFTRFFPFSACAPPVISAQTTSVVAGSNALLGVVAEGSDLLSYAWFEQRPGTPANKIATTSDPQLSVHADSGSSYYVQVTSECGGSTTSASIPVVPSETCTPPSIVQPPVNASVARGTEATLFLTATSNATSYQWYAGEVGTAPGELGDQSHPLADGNAPTIRVSPQATTKYWVLVRNACGEATAAVTVTVCDPPSITTPPESQTITRGESAPLSVTTTSPSTFTLQWYIGVPPHIDQPVAGATSETTSVSPQTTTSYFVRIANQCTSVDSAPATITVNEPCAPASITAQSHSTTITSGDSTTLSVTPAGSTPRTIQWYLGTPAASTAISGATDATYDATPDATTSYFAVVTNDCGTATSTPVTITVTDACVPASISAQSGPATITEGGSTTLSITPAGSAPRTIQWYRGATAITGAHGTTYLASPATTTTYAAVVTNDCGEATSTPVTITVVPACVPATIASQSSSTSIVTGDSTTLSIAPAGSTPRTIQWYTGTPGPGSSLLIPGANASTYEVSPIAMTTYFAVATNDCGSATSTPVTITVTAACVSPSVTAQSGSTSIVRGDSTTVTVSAIGTAPRTVQWYTGTPANLAIISGAMGTSYVASPDTTTSYFAIVSNACGATNSTPATITVTDACVPATISAQSGSTSITTGESAVLSIVVAGSTPRTIQWYRGTPASSTLINGATTSSLNVSPAVTTTYFARVTNSCGSDDSAPVTVTVDCIRPSISAQPQPDTIEQGQSVTLSVSGDDVDSYQWYSNAQGFFAPISGADGTTLHDTPQSTRQYFVRLGNSCGSSDSNTVFVTVNPATCNSVFITTQPLNKSVTEGQSATVSVIATGTSPQYQWQQNVNGVWTNLVGKTAASLTVTPAAGTYLYRVFVSNTCSGITSTVVTVTVGVPCTPPAITSQPIDPNFTVIGQSANLTVGATGSDLQYQWYREGVLWDVATGPTIQVFAGTQTLHFYCVVSNACGSVQSNTITVESLCEAPHVILQPSGDTLAPGQSTVLKVSAGGSPLLRYQWYERPQGGSFTPITGETSISVTVVPQGTTDYRVRVTNDCGFDDSNIATIIVQ
jgi:hypothetical protein